MKRSSTRGVTLIELLIAVSLLSLLSVGMLMALRIGLSSMDKADAKLMANRRSVSTQQILRSELEGFMPVGVMCSPGGTAVAQKVPFFEGHPQSMRFVSSYSLDEAARGLPRVLELAVIPGEERGVRLIVNESVYTGPLGAATACIAMVPDVEAKRSVPQFLPITPRGDSFVLADKLASCSFSYRKTMPEPVFEAWMPVWTPLEWPSAVRIDMVPLDPSAGRVPLVTATVPIRVNRVFGQSYADEY